MTFPMFMTVLDVARAWGVPPWTLTAEEPTSEVIGRWFERELTYRRLQPKVRDG